MNSEKKETAGMADRRRLRVLVCGASGLIGAVLCKRLEAQGHEVIRGLRRPTSARDVAMDFRTDTTIEQWLPRVQGMHVVINAVGIIVETGTNRFDAVHHLAPAALFRACAKAGVGRVIQISALGADRGDTPYFHSKRAADDVLRALPVQWQVLYPSLVYAQDGNSAAMFRTLASLPVIPVPELGEARFQPVHIDDLVDTVVTAIAPAIPPGQCIEVVGASRMSYRAMLDTYRQGMQLPAPMWATIPAPCMTMAAYVARCVPGSKLTPDTWRMLRRGCHGDAAPLTRLLGHRPRAIGTFIAPGEAECLRHRAVGAWRMPMLRIVMALVWLATALVTLFAYPLADSLALLGAVGLHGTPAIVTLYAAVFVDAAMAVGCLRYPSRRLWALQAALVAGYSLIIAVALPEFLWHPFGPVLKNLPILAILFILYVEQESWNTSPSR